MKPLLPATADKNQQSTLVEELTNKWAYGDPDVRRQFPAADLTCARAAIKHDMDEMHAREEIFMNDRYQVHRRMFEDGRGVHLSIRRLDRKPIHDWRDLQQIKNQLIGRECEAIEIYPAESRKVDAANQFHLWGIKDPTFRFPFGFDAGRLVSEEPIGRSVNRPFEKGHK